MAEELQSLLAKINEEGVKKAEAEAARIIEKAKNDAKAIKAQAQAEAEMIVKQAGEQGDLLKNSAESAVRQASRDILLKLQQELESRINRAVSGTAEQAMTPEFMAGLIRDLAAKFATAPNAQITVLSAAKDVNALNAALTSALKSSLSAQPKVFADSGIKGGLEVSFKDGQVYFDFTAEAVTELVGAYVGTRLASMLENK